MADDTYFAKVRPLHWVDLMGVQRHNHNPIDGAEPKCMLPDAVEGFLRCSRRQVLLLQGGAGSGKTNLMRHLDRSLWRAYKRGTCAFFPVMVSLAGLKQTH